MNQPATLDVATVPFLRRAFDWWLTQLRHVFAPTIFFFVGFNLILWTKHLILREHDIDFSGFVVATLAALLVGKAVLVTDNLPLMRRFDGGPLIQPILFKTIIYWAVVFVARLLEHFVRFWLIEGNPLEGFLPHMIATFSWHRFAAIQIWILVLFLIYVTASEVAHLFGRGELWRLFFTSRPTELQLNRRQRIRELLHLSRLIDAHPVGEFRDPASPAHAQLIAILERLAR